MYKFFRISEERVAICKHLCTKRSQIVCTNQDHSWQINRILCPNRKVCEIVRPIEGQICALGMNVDYHGF